MKTTNSLVLVLGLAAIANTARADQLITSAAFSGPIGQATGLQYFDPTLGTLNSVDVQIFGTLKGQIEGGGSCDPACVPTPYAVVVNQDFSSFLLGQFFSFSTPAEFIFTGSGSIADLIPILTDFTYSFDFTNGTDLVGSASVGSSGGQTPPSLVNGTRGGFLTPAIPVNDIIDVSTTVASSPGATQVIGLESDGTIMVTYNYTPNAPAGAVPEAPEWTGVGGLLLLAVCSLRLYGRHSLCGQR